MKKLIDKQVDVVIVGAGTVGPLAAIELTLGGVHVLVLERLGEASTVLKAGGIGPLGIEALQRRGMGAAIASSKTEGKFSTEQKESDSQSLKPKYSGHFASSCIAWVGEENSIDGLEDVLCRWFTPIHT